MKIIEALKQIKDLYRKADDIRHKIAKHVVDFDFETPVYPNQREKINEWKQSYLDILKEISRLQYAIQKTNIETQVEIEIGGKFIKKSIAEWILRRKKLVEMEINLYLTLNDGQLKDSKTRQSNGEILDVKVRRYYDPEERDKKLNIIQNEPSLIDGKLEIINAVTNLIE